MIKFDHCSKKNLRCNYLWSNAEWPMCNNSLLFIKKEIKTSVCEIYDRQDMTVSIVLGLMIFHYFAKNAIVTIIERIYFLFTYQF